MVVAIAVGRPGINMLLVASQVALSIVLPFVAFPLIWLTSRADIMRVAPPHHGHQQPAGPAASAASEDDAGDAPPLPVGLAADGDEGLSVGATVVETVPG